MVTGRCVVPDLPLQPEARGRERRILVRVSSQPDFLQPLGILHVRIRRQQDVVVPDKSRVDRRQIRDDRG